PVVVSVGRLAMKSFLWCGSSTLLPVSGRDDDQDAELAALAELKLDRHDYLLSVCTSGVRAQLGPPLAGVSGSSGAALRRDPPFATPLASNS
ncbi:MAG TPA: hypothetical protein VNO32_47465, partial [Candidatus Acidoferrum sp.]|nr:hypothetical protein [Candidatus Acidoferrum sp.]